MKKNLFYLISFLLFCLYSCNSSDRGNKTAKNEDEVVPEVKSIFINGDSIHYIDIGKGDPVVFVHGAVGDYRTWGAQMDTFAKKHRVIAYSRRFAYPNKQKINDSADLTVIANSNDLSEILKVLNLGPVHLVGHSYGAFTALLTTIDHPGLVRSLTLGEAPVISLLQNVPGGDTILNNFITKTFVPAAEAFKNNNDEKAVDVFVGSVIGDSLFFSKLSQENRDMMMANTPELKGVLFSKNVFPSLTCDDLKKIKVPVLLLTGDRSPLFFTSIASELDRCLSNKKSVTLPNSSHGLEFENPVEFNKIVLGFIDKN
jgi:pimeloyl-ACP methyl ester carboxylesterase